MTVLRTYFAMILICCSANVQVLAQRQYSTKSKKAIKNFGEALKYYHAKRSSEALTYLDKAIKADPEFIEAHMVKGDCLSDINDMDAAINEYKKVVEIDPHFFVLSYKQLADAEMAIGRYAPAEMNYRLFLDQNKDVSPEIRSLAEKSLKNAMFGAKAVQNPVPFEPKNLGPSINTADYEYFPVLTADEGTLVFTRNSRVHGGMDYQEDFYISVLDGSQWKEARNLGSPINTDDNEGAQSITADGSQLFFIGCNRRGGKGSCDIYSAQKEGDTWGKPQNLGAPVNTSKWESQPSISADGKTLYFASNRTGGEGSSDIWITHKAPNGKWTVPRNLGTRINTEFSEETPYIHPDGVTLYFTSDGHVGMGKKDIFVTRKDSLGNWDEPENLGWPINTWNDEQGLFVAASGEEAYFSSDRDGGFGKLDIYDFKLYQQARPVKVDYVKGKVTDKLKGTPIQASFELIDLATSEIVVRSESDKLTGDFLVTLPVNHQYALNVSKPGYLFYSEHFSLTGEQKLSVPEQMDVKLQPISYGEKVVLKNIFFETASYELLPTSLSELETLINFLTDNPDINIEIGGHTDNVGEPQSNLILSQNRAKAVADHLVLHGIDKVRIQYKGYGETQPVDTNSTPEGRSHNRRTEFKVMRMR